MGITDKIPPSPHFIYPYSWFPIPFLLGSGLKTLPSGRNKGICLNVQHDVKWQPSFWSLAKV